MPGLFISYRREDCPGHAGRIFDHLRTRFGEQGVFMDVSAIEAGVDFVEVLDRAVGSCDALLAIIGPEWLNAAHNGTRRLDDPRDFVRLEIAGALARNVRVLPVLVDGAPLPDAQSLPPDLQPLTRRQAVELRDARWDDDIERLTDALARIVTSAPPSMPRASEVAVPAPPAQVTSGSHTRAWLAVALAAIILVTIGVASRGYLARPAATTPPPTTATAPPRDTPVAAAPANRAAAPVAPSAVPTVVGKPLDEAREILRRAGVPFRVRVIEDRTSEPGLVQAQALARPAEGDTRPLLVVTTVATSSIVIHFNTGNERLADDLVTYLRNQRSAQGSVVRRQNVPVRAEVAGHVGYSDARLASQAAAVAQDVSAYAAKMAPRTGTFDPVMLPRVARGALVIGIPDSTR